MGQSHVQTPSAETDYIVYLGAAGEVYHGTSPEALGRPSIDLLEEGSDRARGDGA